MIVLTCTNCRARLEMDDAFAGGVCRCMYCGTIQTVPSHLKRPGAATKVKVIHQTQPRPTRGLTGNGSGEADASGELDQLADVVAATSGSSSGSGLTGSGLTGSGLCASAPPPPPRVRVATFAPPAPWWKRHRAVLVGLAGAACLVAAVTALFVIFADEQAPPPATEVSSNLRTAAAEQRQTPQSQPHFCGLPLTEDRVVVYVLDRGGATGDMFAALKEATYRSVESLGPQRKFQIIFWNNGTTDQAYPASAPAAATSQNLDEARRAFDEVVALGQSEPAAALGKAFASRPDAVVLVTAKPYELDETFVRTVEGLRRTTPARVSVIALGSGEASTALKKLAKSTGGECRSLTADALRAHAQ